MPDGVKETRELNVLPHPFSWTADLDLAEASAATASTEMVLPTLENPTGHQSSHVGDPRFKNTQRIYLKPRSEMLSSL